jgi:hypothetical protein
MRSAWKDASSTCRMNARQAAVSAQATAVHAQCLQGLLINLQDKCKTGGCVSTGSSCPCAVLARTSHQPAQWMQAHGGVSAGSSSSKDVSLACRMDAWRLVYQWRRARQQHKHRATCKHSTYSRPHFVAAFLRPDHMQHHARAGWVLTPVAQLLKDAACAEAPAAVADITKSLLPAHSPFGTCCHAVAVAVCRCLHDTHCCAHTGLLLLQHLLLH